MRKKATRSVAKQNQPDRGVAVPPTSGAPTEVAVGHNGNRPEQDVDAWCDRFVAECRSRGIRLTPQRMAVYRAVAEDTSHPSVEAVRAKLSRWMGPLPLATVYRTLEFLEREGLIRRVSTTESVCRFDANRGAHQHLVCRQCGRISDWLDESLCGIAVPRAVARGFHVESLDIRIVGLCEACGRTRGARREPGTAVTGKGTQREADAPASTPRRMKNHA
jgi:Fur family peroxide stress response transcriptional regulator